MKNQIFAAAQHGSCWQYEAIGNRRIVGNRQSGKVDSRGSFIEYLNRVGEGAFMNVAAVVRSEHFVDDDAGQLRVDLPTL